MRELSEKNFHFLSREATNFKMRFNIRPFMRHKEDVSAQNSIEVLERMEENKTFLATYTRNNVFNIDETCIFYKMEPN